ncbi:MAG TPA: prenyltransferase [Thiobacillaceae bacterium]|nr:prenyltransferase [Thiobacillaceae bacterium]
MNKSTAIPLEPTPAALANPAKRYLLATRPAFLSITLAGCLLGFATTWHAGLPFDAPAAAATLILALLAHAGVNVLNDYYDHLNGTDAANTDRLFPYTGGSRFIQNGVFTPRQTLAFGLALFAAVIAGGLWLMARSGPGLFWIGLAGLAIGWAYSAPPLKLNSRGLGELCVATGFLLVVVGADYVQRGAFDPLPWLAGLPYALLTTNILYINQFPDRQADLAAGKRHWVARLAPEQAAHGYGFLLLLAAAWLVGISAAGRLPPPALVALLGMLPALAAGRELRAHAAQPAALAPAIRKTIAAAHLHALLLAGVLTFWSAP